MLFPHNLMKSRVFRVSATGMMASLLFIVLVVGMMLSLPQGRARAQVKAASAAKPQAASASYNKRLHMISMPSRNYRAAGSRKVDTIVMHYMSGINVDRSRWDDPKLSMDILKRYGVSAHYIIARDGTVYKLVDEKNVAWHAGGSIMPTPDNRRNVNSFSVGIEMIATHKSGFTEAQYDAMTTLINGIRSRHNIRHIVGHDEISGRRAVGMGLRKDVKPDPGPMFDWSRVPGR